MFRKIIFLKLNERSDMTKFVGLHLVYPFFDEETSLLKGIKKEFFYVNIDNISHLKFCDFINPQKNEYVFPKQPDVVDYLDRCDIHFLVNPNEPENSVDLSVHIENFKQLPFVEITNGFKIYFKSRLSPIDGHQVVFTASDTIFEFINPQN